MSNKKKTAYYPHMLIASKALHNVGSEGGYFSWVAQLDYPLRKFVPDAFEVFFQTILLP
jgi:hypothetical protein